jgi:MoaA/NifB/PqqE/SkfB family radical SAM enzyme
MGLTLSLSYKCNSRCKTCNIYKKKAQELSLSEWTEIFKNYGKDLFWVTISGGEPFLRNDLPELVCSLYDNCRPAIINIPTNGLLHSRIPDMVKQIAEYCRRSQVVINLSIDEIGARHDAIRGVPGAYEQALLTFRSLRSFDLANVSLGIHSVISKYNVENMPQIYKELQRLNPDSYITEIAEERAELDTIDTDITPAYESYAPVVDFLSRELRQARFNRVGRITRAFRLEYYAISKKILLQKRQAIPCYAGFASAQIAPDGDVWMCCTKAESFGNLKTVDYDFRRVWYSDKATKMRQGIKAGECYCPLANVSYINMLHNLKALARVGWNYIRIT